MAEQKNSKKRKRIRRRIQVKEVAKLSPRMIRVTFTGEELATFNWSGPASHMKLMFINSGFDMPPLPQDGDPRPVTRTYTPRRFDADNLELDVEFVLHGHGPASTWAAQAQVGQWLLMAGPGPAYQIDPATNWLLLAVDDTAIPAACTILDTLPADIRATLFLEVSDATEERQLTTNPNVDVRWTHRGSDVRQAGRPLEAAIADFELPSGPGQIYVGCEAGAMRRIRKHLLTDRGLPKEQIVTRGYWKIGATDHPDRDYGE